MISIIDYGLGNIVSAQQSFLKATKEKTLHADVVISCSPSDVLDSSHIVLPGQGAFKSCIEGLKNISGMIKALEKSVVINEKPFLGICVGMQLLAEFGFENGKHQGLGWIKEEPKLKPHYAVTALNIPQAALNRINKN